MIHLPLLHRQRDYNSSLDKNQGVIGQGRGNAMVSFGEFTANVSLANFTSVLEIAFSISFIFFIFEISPWMKTRSRPLFNEGRKLHLWQRLLAGKKNRSWKYLLKFYFILSIYYPSIYVLAALEIILLVITSVDALCSLGLLIVLGFYPSVSIE
jgi:hypothetical protein